MLGTTIFFEAGSLSQTLSSSHAQACYPAGSEHFNHGPNSLAPISLVLGKLGGSLQESPTPAVYLYLPSRGLICLLNPLDGDLSYQHLQR